ncbi:MAG: hypothetical protein GY717_20500 [Rhodobacteraceae bacterium]|nr:hypothetical protein [Paracoccaceae bacterium]
MIVIDDMTGDAADKEEIVMELKSLTLSLAIATATVTGAFAAETGVTAEAAEATSTTTAPAVTAAAETGSDAWIGSETIEIYGVRVANPLDPATWWEASGEAMDHANMEPILINPIDPEFWVAFIDPQRHSRLHMTLANPATMGQFLDPETYTAMMDMGIWMKWMDLDSFAPLYKLETYSYWMQPGAYLHAMDPATYASWVDIDAYTSLLSAAAETMGIEG